MRVYRLAKKKYCNDLSGVGAEINGGRWNNVGTRMVYTSSSRALACLEVAVHLTLNKAPKNYFIITLELPDSSIKMLDPESLQGQKWDVYPPIELTQTLGDTFIAEGSHAILKVPSAVVEGDHNYLLNPLHTGFKNIEIKKTQPFKWDERIFESNI